MDTILKINNLSVSFNGNDILKKFSIEVPGKRIYGLIGPNGAGKTTLIKSLLNLVPKKNGNILFNSQDISNLNTFEIVRKGISITEQHIQILNGLSVLDNVLVGFPEGRSDRFLSAFFQTRVSKKIEQERKNEAMKLLEFVGLENCGKQHAGSLSYGQKKRLDIARMLAMGPELILMDEPTSGLDSKGIEQIIEIIRDLKRELKTIFIVEHNMDVVREVCDEITVMHMGKTIEHGAPDLVLKSPQVLEVYM